MEEALFGDRGDVVTGQSLTVCCRDLQDRAPRLGMDKGYTDKGYGYKVWTTTSQQQEVNNQPVVILSF